MAAARVGGTGPSGQLSLRGCSQATVATFDPKEEPMKLPEMKMPRMETPRTQMMAQAE